jgi:hypothetical protein
LGGSDWTFGNVKVDPREWRRVESLGDGLSGS